MLVVVLLGGGAFLLFGGNPPERRIRRATSAAGLEHLDVTPGDSPVFNTIAGAVHRGISDYDSTYTAVFGNSNTPEDRVFFFGGTGDVGDPEDFLQKAKPVTLSNTSPISSQGDETREVCGSYALAGRTLIYCAWATANSFGFVAPEAPGAPGAYQSSPSDPYHGVQALMWNMRSDLQVTER